MSQKLWFDSFKGFFKSDRLTRPSFSKFKLFWRILGFVNPSDLEHETKLYSNLDKGLNIMESPNLQTF